jgi:hypothetical protein
MKVLRIVLCAALLTVAINVLKSAANMTFANSPGTPTQPTQSAAPAEVQKTDAQKSFEHLKSLAGKWEGHLTMVPPMPEMDGAKPEITMRVTSRGNALVHEMKESGTPDDPGKYDHPVTMLYVDGEKLFLTHYCDAGNRPRMVARTSADGKKIEFDFVDVEGGTQYGHMHHAVFTIVNAHHHIEDWTYMEPGDKPVHAHMELERAR